MKNIQLFETKDQAVGLEVETPYVTSIDEQEQPVYGDSFLGEKVTLIKDANDIVVCAIKELEDEGYVDLGLPSHKLWASCNLGASSPCEYGNYYAWGETTPKTNYSWSTYFDTTDGGDTFAKYNNDGGLTTLENSDDAVYVATNGEAHMPTKADIQELLDNTTNTWCTCAVGIYFDVCSSSLNVDYSNGAWCLGSYSGIVSENNSYRYYGFSVRGVKNPS